MLSGWPEVLTREDFLEKNNSDGLLQAAVFGSLRAGRAKKRTVSMVGDADSGKSFLLKGLTKVLRTCERLDGGTYQLDDLLGKEFVFLNEFEYDASAKPGNSGLWVQAGDCGTLAITRRESFPVCKNPMIMAG